MKIEKVERGMAGQNGERNWSEKVERKKKFS